MDDTKLLDGIQRDAREEADRILKQAEQQARDKRADLDRQLAQVSREAEAERDKRLKDIQRRGDSELKTTQRRASLKKREYFYNLIVQKAQEKLAGMVDQPGYLEILAKWIAEGVLGLGQDEVQVRCSHREKLTPEIIKKAAALVEGINGKKPVIHHNQEPLAGQGVAIFSMDGRVSFYNQVANRFRRYDQDIKKIIYDGLADE